MSICVVRYQWAYNRFEGERRPVYFISKGYRFLLLDLHVSNNSIMGVLGDVMSLGHNGHSVEASSKC